MCILSMLQSTGGVSIDRFDGGPDRLANSCKHPPSQRRLLYLYSYKIQKDRLAYSRKYSSSFYTSCFNCIFVLVQKIQVCQLFQKNPVSNQQHLVASLLSHQFLSPSGELGIGLVWDNNRTGPDPTATFQSDCWNPLQTELNYLWGVLSCSQDDIRWF